MKINLKQFIKQIDGKDTELTVGQALSNITLTSDKGGKMKMFVLAQDFYKKDEIDLDAADLALIKSELETTKAYNVLVTGQILLLLENTKTK